MPGNQSASGGSAPSPFARLPEFLQGHFFGNQDGGAGLDFLAARMTDTFHFLVQGTHGYNTA
jgi:hypothetical protein